MDKTLQIIFETEDLVAINKPHGLLVHRTPIAKDATEFAIQLLRDQLGCYVFPCHRLDRKTSGVLLFAKNAEMNAHIQGMFQERKIKKIYQAIVRGYSPEKGIIDYPLNNEGKIQEAITSYELLQHFEINLPHHGHSTSRYSLIKIEPSTGRFHQIRKHMAHIFHPILGDRPHGCNKQNKLWKERYGLTEMMLHATSLEFQSEILGKVAIQAEASPSFKKVLDTLATNL